MCPPTGTKVELYKARSFPTDWTYIGDAIDVDYYSHDPTFVRYQGRWWLFTDRGNENVMVYHSTDLETEGWTPHSQNPVVTDRRHAGRQGGRPVVVGDQLYLYFQDGVENYGDATQCYAVTDLSPSTCADQEVAGSPILHEFGTGWASNGMHTFDPWWRGPGKGWRCAVDGVRAQDSIEDLWTIGILDIPPLSRPVASRHTYGVIPARRRPVGALVGKRREGYRAGDDGDGSKDQYYDRRGDRPIDEGEMVFWFILCPIETEGATTVGTSSEVTRAAVTTMFWAVVTLGV